MKHICPNCDQEFEVESHAFRVIEPQGKKILICGTGVNVVYYGETEQQWPLCPRPECQALDQDTEIERTMI